VSIGACTLPVWKWAELHILLFYKVHEPSRLYAQVLPNGRTVLALRWMQDKRLTDVTDQWQIIGTQDCAQITDRFHCVRSWVFVSSLSCGSHKRSSCSSVSSDRRLTESECCQRRWTADEGWLTSCDRTSYIVLGGLKGRSKHDCRKSSIVLRVVACAQHIDERGADYWTKMIPPDWLN